MEQTSADIGEAPRLEQCNTVVTVREGRTTDAKALFARMGAPLLPSGFPRVFLTQVPDRASLAYELERQMALQPPRGGSILHAVPAEVAFLHASAGALEDKLYPIFNAWAASAADKSFHVRLHRRGVHERRSVQDEEARLASYVFDGLDARRQSAQVDFEDPDVVFYVDVVGRWAGASRLTREAMQRYPFLRVP